MTTKNTGLDGCRFVNLDNYRFVNIDKRYGDEVPVEIQDYMSLNPDGRFFEWSDGLYEEIDGVGRKIAAVRLPLLGEGELPVVSSFFAEAVIIGCIEGATNCWARALAYQPENLTATIQVIPDELEDCISSGELEEGSTGIYRVTIETIQRGVELILSGETDVPLEAVRMYARDWRYIDLDSIEADMILQVGLFGKVIFG